MKEWETEYKKYVKKIKPDEELLDKVKGMSCNEKNNRKKIQYILYPIACVLVVSLLIRTNITIYAVDYLKSIFFKYKNVYMMETQIQPKIIDLGELTIKQGENMKLYTSVKELEEQYHLSLLQSPMAYEWDEKYTMIEVYGEEDNAMGVKIMSPYYIMGDLPIRKNELIVPSENTMIPDCIYGDKEDEFFQEYEYQTPIFYSAYFSVSRENVKLERKWERDYERKVKLERYISSKNGVEAMISCEPFEIEGESKGYHPNTQAVFVVDNIEYTLTGRVEIETMKKIIDSLHS